MFGGGVGTFTYKALAGLANSGVGWRSIRMRPLPAAIAVLGSANASVLTPHGLAAISWRLENSGRTLVLNATVPPGSTAEIVLPGALPGGGGVPGKVSSVSEGVLVLWKGAYIAPPLMAGFLGFSHESSPHEALSFTVGSGRFEFSAFFAA